jgi:hypothetical protein
MRPEFYFQEPAFEFHLLSVSYGCFAAYCYHHFGLLLKAASMMSICIHYLVLEKEEVAPHLMNQ